jgi:hypothetical protein
MEPEDPMSWGELERLVNEAEADGVIRRSLRRCRSREELILAARRLGYRITRNDLQRARELHQRESGRQAPAAAERRAIS